MTRLARRESKEGEKVTNYGPMELITKFPGYITRDDNGKIDYDIHPDF